MRLTWDEEGGETGFFGQVEPDTGAAGHKLHHGLRLACPLEEGKELLTLVQVLSREITHTLVSH